MDQTRYQLITRVKKILASLKRRGVIVSWRIDPVFAFFKFIECDKENKLPHEGVLRWVKNGTFNKFAEVSLPHNRRYSVRRSGIGRRA